jgi:hypothetical protein
MARKKSLKKKPEYVSATYLGGAPTSIVQLNAVTIVHSMKMMKAQKANMSSFLSSPRQDLLVPRITRENVLVNIVLSNVLVNLNE